MKGFDIIQLILEECSKPQNAEEYFADIKSISIKAGYPITDTECIVIEGIVIDEMLLDFTAKNGWKANKLTHAIIDYGGYEKWYKNKERIEEKIAFSQEIKKIDL